MERKIMLAGCSGIGKTTVAEWISEEYKIPFISGSFTALIESQRGKTHQEMMNEIASPTEIREREYQLFGQRMKIARRQESFVSDRSFLDSAAYYALKLAVNMPKCDVEDYLALCFQMSVKTTTHLIVLNYGYKDYEWDFEDNHKRITNPWFQLQVGSLIKDVSLNWVALSKPHQPKIIRGGWGRPEGKLLEDGDSVIGTFYSIDGNKLKYLILNSTQYETRKQIIKNFLNR